MQRLTATTIVERLTYRQKDTQGSGIHLHTPLLQYTQYSIYIIAFYAIK
jgi:hypothetical protein